MPEFYSLNDIKEKFGDMFKGISIDLFEKDSKILEAEDELQLYNFNWDIFRDFAAHSGLLLIS